MSQKRLLFFFTKIYTSEDFSKLFFYIILLQNSKLNTVLNI